MKDIIYNSIIINDAPEPWQIGFQDSASPIAEGTLRIYTDTLFITNINNVILISIVYIYIYNRRIEDSLEYSILYSRNILNRLYKLTGAGAGIATIYQALRQRRETKTVERLNETLAEVSEYKNKLAASERAAYEAEILRQDEKNKNAGYEAQIEELNSKLRDVNQNASTSASTSTTTSSGTDNSTGIFTRSPNENNDIFSLLYDYITQPLSVSNFTSIQYFALGILLFTLVLVSSLITIVIYMFNNYWLDKYNIKDRYPNIYKYIKMYRTISYYSVLFNIVLCLICITCIIISCCIFIIIGD
jgi:hypothetical protein